MRNGIRLCCVLSGMLLSLVASFVATRPHLRSTSSSKGHFGMQKRYSSPLFAVLVNTTEYAPDIYEMDLQRRLMEQLLQQTPSDDTCDHQVTSITKIPAAAAATEKTTTVPILGDVWKARLLLLGAAALYGTNFSVVKILGDTMPVGVSSTLRFGMAAIATLPWLLAPDKGSSENKQQPWEFSMPSSSTMAATLAGLEVGMWNSIGYVAQAIGLETTDASKSAFICSLAVVTVPILDFLVGKRMLPREMLGAVMALAGVGFLEGFFGGSSDVTLGSGDLASLLQPLTFGMGFWRMEQAMRRYPEEAGRMTAAQLMAVFVTSAMYCAATPFLGAPLPETSQIMAWLTDPVMLGSLFWTGVITTALTVYMETLALKTLSAAETTLIFSTEPLWGAACAAVLMGEQFGLDAAMGAALILSGCVISNMEMDFLGSNQKGTEEPTTTESVDTHKKFLFSTSLAGMKSGFVSTIKESVDEIEILDTVTNSIAP